MTTQGQLHTRSPLIVTISHPPSYSCGDHYLTQGTNGLTYNMCHSCVIRRLSPTSVPRIILSLSAVKLHLCYCFTLWASSFHVVSIFHAGDVIFSYSFFYAAFLIRIVSFVCAYFLCPCRFPLFAQISFVRTDFLLYLP